MHYISFMYTCDGLYEHVAFNSQVNLLILYAKYVSGIVLLFTCVYRLLIKIPRGYYIKRAFSSNV